MVESDWYWATTLPISLAPSETIAHFGHYFHHHHNAVLVLWLILLMAHAVFHCFYLRNLKAEARRHHTVIYFARLLGRDLRTEESWWPPP